MNFEQEQSFFVESEYYSEEFNSYNKVYSEEQISSDLEIEYDSYIDEIIIDKVPFKGLNNPSGTVEFSDTVRYAVEQSVKLDQYDAEALAETDEWIVSISALESVDSIAVQLGVESFDETGIIENTYVFEFPEQQTTEEIYQSLEDVEEIDFFYPLVEEEKVSRFTPNDDLYPLQWHLNNTGQSGGTAGEDANVEPAWDTVKGDGVVIGIVDDGVQYTHPDLSARYRADLSYDFLDDDPDPAPSRFADHGTSVAGIAAASGNNNEGVSGAAPNASLAGLVYGFNDLTESQPLSYKPQDIDIYNNSWGPEDDGRTLEAPGPLTLAALENGVNSGRGGLGSIYVWAAGNGLEFNDNVNYDGYANSRYTIAISAIDHNGQQSEYSEPGAPIIVAAHSNGDDVGTVTTDLLGSPGTNGLPDLDYTNDFGGTSSAAPLAAGVVGLVLDANPNLTWRDVQHVLVDSARKNDSNDPDWVTNGAGHDINHKYGFGAVDAAAAVSTASSWTNVDSEQTTSGQATVGQTIPDNNATGVSSSISITDDLTIEWVEVVFDADHTYRGNLEIILTSPDGTESILAETHNDPGNNYNNWVFSSARHWDESSLGDWTLTVADGFSQDVGTWNNWQLNIYGTGITNQPSDDNYEENDDISSAYYPGYDWEQTWLSSIDGEGIVNDDDWYDIDVSSGEERLVVDLVSSDVNGDIDLELYDSNGNFLAGSYSGSNNEYIDYTVPGSGIYYLKVYPYSGSGVTYDLWWDNLF